MQSIWQILKADELVRYRDEVNRENRLAVRLLATVGIPLGLASIVIQVLMKPDSNAFLFFMQTGWALMFYVVLLVAERRFIPADYPYATALLYVVQSPAIICAILLGSIWDSNQQAIVFFIFFMAMPMLILDRPLRVMGVSTAWILIFLLVCYFSKPADIFSRDLLHAFEFYVVAIAVANMVIRIRIVTLERTVQLKFSMTHDELTGMQNRRALEEHTSGYLGQSVSIMIAELDQLNMYNDVHGHEFGNQLLKHFASIFAEQFGAQCSYRYGGDEFLNVLVDAEEDVCINRLNNCRALLKGYQNGGQTFNPTFAVGYVVGTPQTEVEFRQMIQLADIYAHQARSQGKGQTVGSVFSEHNLISGVIESNLAIHVNSYERNDLTELPSMSFFTSRAEDILAKYVVLDLKPMVGFFTLQNIKAFNSEFGYAQGDELICFTADVLREAFQGRLLCSITGSQFGILCYQNEIEPGMQSVIEKLSTYKDTYPVVCKAGFAEFVPGESAIMLLDKARAAEKSIENERKTHYRFYDAQLDADIKLREYIVAHLDEAIEKGYLEVYYQPIVRTSTSEICNEEALSRWNDPERGMLSPCTFIPALEENRLVYKLSLHVVRQVLADFEEKQRQGLGLVPVSINLSRHDFEQCDIVGEITNLVDASGVPHDMILIELTESAFTDNQEFLKREVARFRAQGFEVWMDDFGSEYSTLNLLQDLDFDLIKLDMQFMRNSSPSGRNMIIVSSIINMANQMGIATLVEGVENEEHMEALRVLGCDKMQGYLFSKPVSLQHIIAKVHSGTARPAEIQFIKQTKA